MRDVIGLIGGEHPVNDVARALRRAARDSGAAVFGAHLITCSDETEREVAEAFQRDFVDQLLPTLRFWDRSPFRTANLGGRYEFGGVTLAEQHFATPESARPGAFKLLVIKVNSHVSVTPGPEGLRHGTLERYHTESQACGALHVLLAQSDLPAVQRLAEDFHFEGLDRVAILNSAEAVPPEQRLLRAALAQARLQARSVVLEIQDHAPTTPTLHWVLPCVTVNRPDRDTEIVMGLYTVDRRAPEGASEYQGLGDDPAAYEVEITDGLHRVRDETCREEPRQARDHRALIREQIGDEHRRLAEHGPASSKLHGMLEEIAELHPKDQTKARLAFQALLLALGEFNPVLGALILFGHGAASIHHARRAHRLARHQAGRDEAQEMLQEIHARLDQLPPDRLHAAAEALRRELTRGSGGKRG